MSGLNGKQVKYDAHAMDDPTVTDVLFGTNLTQDENMKSVNN